MDNGFVAQGKAQSKKNEALWGTSKDRQQNVKKPTPMIAKKHRDEWRSSAVSEEIIEANVVSIQGNTVVSKICPLEKPYKKLRNTLEGGGWWVTGLEPGKWTERMRWGQLKLDNPRMNADGKTIKYESPMKSATRATFLSIPSQPTFWADVERSVETPLYITEGAKKAGAMLSLGYACVAIPGIYNVAKKKADGSRELIKELKPFLGNRRIVYVYDSDDQPRKKRNVYGAIKRTGKCFQDYGCDVYWVTWDTELGKGIDDVAASQGADAVHDILSKPIRLKTYEESLYRVSNKTIEIHVADTLFADNWACINEEMRRWNPQLGFWELVSESEFRHIISTFVKRCYSEKELTKKDIEVGKTPIRNYRFGAAAVNNTAAFIKASLHVSATGNDAFLRTFKNGTLDLRTKQLKRWDREDYLTWRLETDYAPTEVCPKSYLDFFESSYGYDLIPLLRAVSSMLIDPTAPWGYFPYLQGPSGSGKGTLISLWQKMFPLNSVSSSSDLSNLGTEEGRHQYINNKGLFTAPDVLGYQKGMEAFYELVDNGAMTARKLFSSDPYTRKFGTRYVVASVEPLQVEGSAGWDRRAIVIPTKACVGTRDPNLKDTLGVDHGAFMCWVLGMDTAERNRVLMYWKQSSLRLNSIAQIHQLNDPMASFIDHCLVPAKAGQEMTATDLQQHFAAYAAATGRSSTMSPSRVGSKLRSMLPHTFIERRRFGKDEPNPKELTMKPACYKVTVRRDVFRWEVSAGSPVLRVSVEHLNEGGLHLFDSDTHIESSDLPQQFKKEQFDALYASACERERRLGRVIDEPKEKVMPALTEDSEETLSEPIAETDEFGNPPEKPKLTEPLIDGGAPLGNPNKPVEGDYDTSFGFKVGDIVRPHRYKADCIIVYIDPSEKAAYYLKDPALDAIFARRGNQLTRVEPANFNQAALF